MTLETITERSQTTSTDAFSWLGRVLSSFAIAEQAIGELSVALDLPITKGSLSNLATLRAKLAASGDRKCVHLEARIERWNSDRPIRHLLAHATITILYDVNGEEVIVTRHLPRDDTDPSPDRTWSIAERTEMLRRLAADGRSISDRVRDIKSDAVLMKHLRAL